MRICETIGIMEFEIIGNLISFLYYIPSSSMNDSLAAPRWGMIINDGGLFSMLRILIRYFRIVLVNLEMFNV